MQRFWKYIFLTIIIIIFLTIIFFKILPIFSYPTITIIDKKISQNNYIITGNLQDGNNIKIFDKDIVLDSKNNFQFQIIKYNINNLTITATNKWGQKTIQNFVLD